MKEKGVSTLGGRKVWWDEDVMRLNADGRGKFLGEFVGSDQILVITKTGMFRTGNFDLSNHYEDNILIIEKFRPEKIFSAAYFDAEQNYYYIKRFTLEETEKAQSIIGEHPESKLLRITEVEYPRLEVRFGGKNKSREPEIIEVADFIGVKSYKAKGKRLSTYEVSIIKELEPLIRVTPPDEIADEKETSPPGRDVPPDGPVTASQMSLDL
jgi:topoisomerase-4 subunit A